MIRIFGFFILSSIAAIAALLGTGVTWLYFKSHKPQPENVAILYPPPLPPNCPESAERSNITLPNGALADVNLFRVGNTLLYSPREWGGTFDLKKVLNEYKGRPIPAVYGGIFHPNYHSDECPGVIHEFTPTGSIPTFGFDFGDPVRKIFSKNFDARSTISGISLWRRNGKSDPEQEIVDWPVPYTLFYAYNDDIVVDLRLPRQLPDADDIYQKKTRLSCSWIGLAPHLRGATTTKFSSWARKMIATSDILSGAQIQRLNDLFDAALARHNSNNGELGIWAPVYEELYDSLNGVFASGSPKAELVDKKTLLWLHGARFVNAGLDRPAGACPPISARQRSRTFLATG